MKTTTIVACAAVVLSIALSTSFRQPVLAQATESEGVLNTVSLNLTSQHLDPLEGNQVIRAFVPTGSKSVNCLATLNEILTDLPVTGMTLFCGEREPFAFGGVPGMLVSVFFTQPPPAELQLSITLYQRGARRYGAPVLCNTNNGC